MIFIRVTLIIKNPRITISYHNSNIFSDIFYYTVNSVLTSPYNIGKIFFLQKILCNIFQSKNSGNFYADFFLNRNLWRYISRETCFLKNYSSYGLSLWHLYKIPGISGLDSGTIGTIEFHILCCWFVLVWF